MSKQPKPGTPKIGKGGRAGRSPGRDAMVGTRPDKYGKGPLPKAPRTPMPPPDAPGDDSDEG